MKKKTPYLSLRMKPEELERYEEVLENVSTRYPGKIIESELIREIIGLSAPAWLTPKEIDFFRTGKGDISDERIGIRESSSTKIRPVSRDGVITNNAKKKQRKTG